MNYFLKCSHYAVTLIKTIKGELSVIQGGYNKRWKNYQVWGLENLVRSIAGLYQYTVMQSDRNSLKTDTFNEPTTYEPVCLR